MSQNPLTEPRKKTMTKELSIRSIFTSILLSMAFANLADADMIVDNAILVFEPGKTSRQDISVRNTGEKPLYIKVTPSIVHNPGTPEQHRETIRNPRAAGLLVSPNKLVVPPGGRKIIRFVDLGKGRQKEGVYRVTLAPVAGELIARESGLKVMIGYEILVLAQPEKPESLLEAQREGRRLRLANNGNTDIYLFQGRQCPQGMTQNRDCVKLRDKRLYPGNHWDFELPLDAPAQFQMTVGNDNTLKTIP